MVGRSLHSPPTRLPGRSPRYPVEEDLIFITRDRTYRNRTAYLVQEYRERTGSALTIARQDIRCPPGADPV